jgi:NMD protein affecting ribosome stability and mRNA decay
MSFYFEYKFFPEFDAELNTYLELEIKIEFTYCDSCLKLRRGAYNAIMNISREQNFKDSEIDEILELAKNQVNVLIKKDRMAFLAKYQIGKNRVKLYLGSEKLAKSLTQILLNKWGGISNEYTTYNPKSKLKGKKHDKLIINLKLPSMYKGDIISIHNQPFIIKSIRNDIINLTNLSSKRNEHISLKDEIDYQLIRKRENLTKYQVVSIYDDIIQIMDEETYELYEILKNDELLDITIQSKLLGLKYDNRVFIIPKNDENV